MKRKNFVAMMCCILAMLCTCFVSCKDDDDDNNSQDQLYGVWKLVSTEVSEDGEVEKESATDKDYDLLTFSATQLITVTYENGIPGEPEIENITYSGNTFKGSEGISMTFSVNGDTLTLTGETEDEGIKIKFVATYKKFNQ